MRSKFRRLLALVLTIAMVLSMMSTGAVALAADSEQTEEEVAADAEAYYEAEEPTTEEAQTEAEEEEPAPVEEEDVYDDLDQQEEEELPEEPAPEEVVPEDTEEEEIPEAPAEEEQVEEADASMPAFYDEARVGDVTVRVEAEAGTFPAGVHLEAGFVTSAAQVQEAEDAAADLLDEDTVVLSTLVLDVRVVDEAGNEVEPAEGKEVKVSFVTDLVDQEGVSAEIVHIPDEGEAEKLETSVDGNVVSADTDSFSTYTVTITYSPDENYRDHVITIIPNNASKVYNGDSGADPELTAAVTVLGENYDNTAPITTGTLNYEVTRVSGNDVGQYKITVNATAVPTGYTVVTGEATFTVEPKPVTVTGIKGVDKEYDGKKTAELDMSTASIEGRVGSDALSVSATGTFVDATPGSNKDITVSNITLSGAKAGNYVVSSGNNTSATISKKLVTVSGIEAADKVYDGTTDATVSCDNAQFTGVVGNEKLTASATGHFETADVGQNKKVIIDSITLGGDDLAHYELNTSGSQKSTKAAITAKDFSGATVTIEDQTYTGTQIKPAVTVKVGDQTLTGTQYRITGYGENTDVGIGTVTIQGLGDYAGQSGTFTFNIKKKVIQAADVTGLAAQSKEYDGTSTAQVSADSASFGAVDGDDVALEVVSADYYSGTDKTSKVASDLTVKAKVKLTGTKAGNYQLNGTTVAANGTFAITAKPVTVSGITAEDRLYQSGSTSATLVYDNVQIAGVVGNDEVTVTATGTFDNDQVGSGKTVNISGITLGGADAANYALKATGNQKTTKASILAADLSAAVINIDPQEYTGSQITPTTMEVKIGTTTLGSDDYTVTGYGANVNVGTGTVTIKGLGKYAGQTKTGEFQITKKTITEVTGITAQNKVYDGTSTAQADASSAVLTGKVGTEDVSVEVVSADFYSGTAKTANAADGLAVKAQVKLTGEKAGNYKLASATADAGNANITKKQVTVNGITAQSRAYSAGDTSATLVCDNAQIAGIVGNDDVTVASATGAFTSPDVGTGKTVNISNYVLDGAAKDNYEVKASGSQKTTTADIYAADLSAAEITIAAQDYSGGQITPTGDNVVVRIGTNPPLTPGDDYNIVSYGANVDAGTGTVTIKGLGAFAGQTKTGEFQIRQKEITVTGVTAEDKVYDGTSTAQADVSSAVLTGKVGTDDLSLEVVSADFYDGTDKTAAAGNHTVKAQVKLVGAKAGNYTLSADTVDAGTATIKAKQVTVSGIQALDKPYDGSADATLDCSNAQVVGVLGNDDVFVASAVGAFDNANVGTDKTVTISAINLDGAAKDNYVVVLANSQKTDKASILAKDLSVAEIVVSPKPYTGTQITPTATTGDVVVKIGDVPLEENTDFIISGYGPNVDAGTGTLTIKGVGNYAGQTKTAEFQITKLDVTVTGGLSSGDKIYDSTSTAQVNADGATFDGVVNNDDVSLEVLSADFYDGTAKTAAAGEHPVKAKVKLAGEKAGNYNLTADTVDAGNATIEQKLVTVSGIVAQDKTYDGNNIAAFKVDNALIVGVLGNDVVNVDSVAGTFDSAEVGTDKTVTINTITLGGASAANYAVSADGSQKTDTASIIAEDWSTVEVTIDPVVYNGEQFKPEGTALTVKDGTDTLTENDVNGYAIVGYGENVDVGTGTVDIVGLGKYAGQTYTAEFQITKKSVSVSGLTAKGKVYDGNVAAEVNADSAVISDKYATDDVSVEVISAAFYDGDSMVSAAGNHMVKAKVKLVGEKAGNYQLTLTTVEVAEKEITRKPVAVSGIWAKDKVHDGNTNATLMFDNVQFVGVVGNEKLTVDSATGTFDSADVGANKIVTIENINLAGADVANYVVDAEGSQHSTKASILAADLSAAEITVTDQTYTGARITPETFEVKVGSDTLEKDTDYSIDSYGENINVGIGTLTIVGLGQYAGQSKTGEFNIQPKTVSVDGLVAQNKVYDTTSKAEVDASNAVVVSAAAGDDVSVEVISAAFYEGSAETSAVGTHDVKAKIKLVGTKAGNYLLDPVVVTLTATIAADANTIAAANVTIPSETYTGSAITPTVEVRNAAGELLVEDTDYEITDNGTNTNVADNGSDNFVVITGKGGYEGTQKVFFTINPAPVTVSGIVAKDKAYDGTTNASLEVKDASITGTLNGDELTVNVTGTFDSADVGTDKTVTFSAITLAGDNASNYTVAPDSQMTAQADIEAKVITAYNITANDREYIEGETFADLNVANAEFTGLVGNETVGVEATGAFADDAVGQNKEVTITYVGLTGTNAANYRLNTVRSQQTTTASITGLNLADAEVASVDAQEYTGVQITPDASAVGQVTFGPTSILLEGTDFVIDPNGYGENVDVGKGTLTLVGLNQYGGSMKTLEFDITPKEVTISGVTAENKKYDGTSAATVDASGATIEGLSTADDGLVTVVATGYFVDDADAETSEVGASKVKLSLSLTGPKAGNYVLSSDVGHADALIVADDTTFAGANITVKSFTYKGEQIKPTAADVVVKALDGKTLEPDVDYEVIGFGTNLNVAGNGTENTITIEGKGRYSGTQTVDITIVPAPVKVTGIKAMDKAYDGTVTASLNTDNVSIEGTFNSDELTVSGTGTFKNANVGEGKLVTFSGLTLGGDNAANYTLSSDSQTTDTANITKLPVTITGIVAKDRAYEAGVNAAELDCSHARIDTVVGSEILGVTAEGVFSDDKVGTNKTVYITYLALTGDTKDNYSINEAYSQPTATASILGQDLTDAIVTVDDQTYNSQQLKPGDNAVQVTLHGVTLRAGEHFTVDPDGYGENVNAGSKAGSVTITGLGIYDGSSVEAYFNIVPATVTVSGITAENKMYDGTSDAVVHTENAVFAGIYDSDVGNLGVTCTGTFVDGDGIRTKDPNEPDGYVILSGHTLYGTAASNYELVLAGSQMKCENTFITKNPDAVQTWNVELPNYAYTSQKIEPLFRDLTVTNAKGEKMRYGSDWEIKDDGYGTNVDVADNGTDNYLTIVGLGNYEGGEKQVLFNITPVTVTIDGIIAEDKVYDGNTVATLDTSSATIHGLLGSDDVQVTAEEGAFADPNVEEDKPVSITGLALTGTKATNYLIDYANSQTSDTASITPKDVTVTVVEPAGGYTKVYGDPDPDFDVEVEGLVVGDSLNYRIYRNPGEDVGEYEIRTAEITAQANYNVTYGTAILTITQRELTLDASTVKAEDKDYDGTTEATLDFSEAVVTGIQFNDEITFTGKGTFSNKNAGDRTFTVDEDSIVMSGAAAKNYTLTVINNDGSNSATINPIALTVDGFTAEDKVYDGTTAATVGVANATIEGVKTGDDVSVASAVGTFEDKNVGTDKVVYVTDIVLTGADAGNYNVSGLKAETTASISQKEVTITGVTAAEKIYDGTTDADLDGSQATITGLVDADQGKVSVGKVVGAYDDAEAGTGKAITFSEVELLGTEAGNYYVQLTEPHITGCEIKAKEITIQADDAGKVYGDNDPAELTWHYVGDEPIEGDTLVVTLERETGDNVNEYDITFTSLADQNGHGGTANNYHITYLEGIFTITPAEVTVTADDASKTYGDADPAPLTATVEGMKNGEDPAEKLTYTVQRVAGEEAGQYDINVTGEAEQGNYKVTYVGGTFTINSKEITVTAQNASKAFGAPDPELTYTITPGLVEGDTLTFEVYRDRGEDGGQTYKIFFLDPVEYMSGHDGSDAPNYHITYVRGDFGIDVQPVTIKADNLTMVYGDEVPELTATVNGAPAAMVEYTVSFDPTDPNNSDENINKVGEHKLIVTAPEHQGSYTVSVEGGILTITPAPVVVKADDLSKTFGENDPTLTATITGLKNGDDESVITYNISRDDGQNVGTYDITPSGDAVQGNYAVTFEKGIFTIVGAEVTVSGITVQTKVYDGNTSATLVYDDVTFTGIEDGAVVSVTATGTFEDANAGEGKTVNLTGLKLTGADAANYVLNVEDSQDSALGTITKRAVTVKPDNAGKVYGDPDPDLTATVSGVVSGETLIYNLRRDEGEDVGTYVIHATEGAAQTNYDVTYMTGTFTISSRELVIKASSIGAKDKVYDQTDVAELVFDDVEVTGIQKGDELTFKGTGTFENANAGQDKKVSVDVADITVSGANADNYTVVLDFTGCDEAPVCTTANITPAPVKVNGITASDKTYDTNTDVELNWNYATFEGVYDGDDVKVVSADGVFVDASAGEDKTVNITNIVLGGAQGANYFVDPEEGVQTTAEATINRVVVTFEGVTAEDKVYDGTKDAVLNLENATIVAVDSANSATVATDVANGGIEIDSIKGAFTTANANDEPLAISFTEFTLKGELSGNYQTVNPSEIHIFAKISMCPVTVRPVANEKVFGDPDPELTWEIVSVNGDENVTEIFEYKGGAEPVQDELDLSVERVSGQNVGTYAMQMVGDKKQSGHGGSVPNYIITFDPETVYFTINPAEVVVTADNLSKIYGEEDPDLTVSMTGLVDPDGTDKITYTISRAEGEDVGTYVITVTGDEDQGNYHVTFVNGEFTINTKEIKIIAKNTDKAFGALDPEELEVEYDPQVKEGDVLKYEIYRDPGEDAGRFYNIFFRNKELYTYQSGREDSDAKNYHVTFVSGLFGIGCKAVTVTPNDLTIVYGDAVPELTAKVNGAPAAMIEYSVIFDPTDDMNSEENINKVGEHRLIAVAEEQQGSYTVQVMTGTLTILPAPVVVKADDATKVYDKDATNPGTYTATVTGLKNGEDESLITYEVTRAEGETVGEYVITPSGDAEQGNYAVTYETGKFTITPATLKVTDGITASDKTYDGLTDAELDTSGAVFETLMEGDNVTVTATGTFNTPNAGENKTVYISDLKLEGDDAANYVLDADNSQKVTSATIEKKAVTVTPEDDSKTYGDPDPIFTVNVEGVVPGDTLAYIVRRDPGEFVGTYKIRTAEHAAQTNYTVTYNTADFTISTRELTLDASTIVPQDKVYDGTDVAELDFSNVAVEGIQFEDVLTFSGTGTFESKNVGTQKVSVEADDITIGGGRAKNYTVSIDYSNTGYDEPVIGEATISQLGIKVSGITAESRKYNTTAVAELDYSAAEFETIIDGDDVTVESATGTFVDADGNPDGNVGENKKVSITDITLGGADGGNYFVEPTEGEQTSAIATISPVEVTLVKNTVFAEDKTYDGTKDAVLDWSGAELETVDPADAETLEIDRDDVQVEKVEGSFHSADAGDDKVIDIVTFTLTGDKSGNYVVELPPEGHVVGNIKSREVTVVPIHAEKVYGEDDPDEFTWKTLNDDDLVYYNGVRDELNVTVTRVEGEDAKDYALIASGEVNQSGHAGSNAPNYHITYAEGVVFTINPAAVTVIADDFEKVYDNNPKNPAELTATVEGLQRGDDASVLSYTVTREKGEDVGQYVITPSGEEAQGNYTVTYVTGTFTITTREITVVADNKTKTYHEDSDPELTATIVGNVAKGDKIEYELYRDRGEDGGQDYMICFHTPNTQQPPQAYQSGHKGSTARNYHVTFVAGYLTIDRKAVTVTPNHITIAYGDSIPQDEAVVNGAPKALIEYKIVLDPSDPNNKGEKAKAIGNHRIMIKADEIQGGYEVKTNTGILTIEPREVKLVWGKTQFVYNGKNQVPTATVGNLVKGDTCKVTVSGAKKMPGTYTATAVKLSNSNYKLPSNATTTFVITKAKQTAPAAPTVKSVSTNSITIYTQSGLEYSIDGGKTWQKSGTFTGLKQNTKYNIIARKAETATHFASPASKARAAKTQTHNNASLLNKDLKLTQKNGTLRVQWGKVPVATGYDIYIVPCGDNFGSKPVAKVSADTTVFTTKTLKGKAIDQSKAYKAIVVAKSGSTVLCKSVDVHAAGMLNKVYSNAIQVFVNSTKVSLKKGGTFQITASQVLENTKLKALTDIHTYQFRYLSSNTSVVKVSSNGKITAVGKGTAIVLVIARNMTAKRIEVTVK